MRAATGSYHFDSASALFFRTPVLRLLQRDGRVVGRFGRRGILKGTLSDLTLEARWSDRERTGWLKLTFDDSYQHFEGRYGLVPEQTETQCSGERKRVMP